MSQAEAEREVFGERPDGSRYLVNNWDISFFFKGPNEEKFYEEIGKTGMRLDEAYFHLGCDHRGGVKFDLLRYGVRAISTHFNISMKIIDGF